MKKINWLIISIVATLFLNGCASNNVRRFLPDPLHKTAIEKHLKKSITVDVSMTEGDQNSIMCRMVGNIYLPNKMTYSQYVEDAFKKVLVSADRWSHEKIADRTLAVVLTKVDFSSTSGEWYINANVKIGNNSPTIIKNTTKFGTSWIGEYACKNAAESFEEAISNFVNEVLTNHNIIHKLGS